MRWVRSNGNTYVKIQNAQIFEDLGQVSKVSNLLFCSRHGKKVPQTL